MARVIKTDGKSVEKIIKRVIKSLGWRQRDLNQTQTILYSCVPGNFARFEVTFVTHSIIILQLANPGVLSRHQFWKTGLLGNSIE